MDGDHPAFVMDHSPSHGRTRSLVGPSLVLAVFWVLAHQSWFSAAEKWFSDLLRM
jgi:hypothetical protein